MKKISALLLVISIVATPNLAVAGEEADLCFERGSSFRQKELDCSRAILVELQSLNALLASIDANIGRQNELITNVKEDTARLVTSSEDLRTTVDAFGPNISNISAQASSIDQNVADIKNR